MNTSNYTCIFTNQCVNEFESRRFPLAYACIASRISFKTRPQLFKGSDSTIHWINHYPLDNSIDFDSSYPLDSDLSAE